MTAILPMTTRFLPGLAIAAMLAGTAAAQTDKPAAMPTETPAAGQHTGQQAGQHGGQHGGHAGMAAMAGPKGDQGPSSMAFAAANAAMHADMDIVYTGKADVDFARGMIAHHKGAVAMATILLEHGTDPAMRKLAETVVATQTAEIAEMEAWLAANGQ